VLSLITLFDKTDPYGENIHWHGVDAKVANAVRFIVSLRNRVRAECDEKVYVVLLLDCLLIQIGGVALERRIRKSSPPVTPCFSSDISFSGIENSIRAGSRSAIKV
jgi:hypothetical protein